MLQRETNDFLEILEAFIDQYNETTPFFSGFEEILRAAAAQALDDSDARYMPGFKITNLMADMVNIAASVSCEGWLSDQEARKQLADLLHKDALLMRQFRQEARLERARYEPVMLAEKYATPLEHRNAMLRQRFGRMLKARQSEAPLPDLFITALQEVADKALEAECFELYRQGALLQFFAEMLQAADNIAENTFDALEGLAALHESLSERGTLWRRFQMKEARFRVSDGDPLHTNMWPDGIPHQANAAMVFEVASHRGVLH